VAKNFLSFNCKTCPDRISCMIRPGRTMYLVGVVFQVPCKVLKRMVTNLVHSLALELLKASNEGFPASKKSVERSGDISNRVSKSFDITELLEVAKQQLPKDKQAALNDASMESLQGFVFFRLYSMYDLYGKARRRAKYLMKQDQERAKVWVEWLNNELP
jgi:hypothetical protein